MNQKTITLTAPNTPEKLPFKARLKKFGKKVLRATGYTAGVIGCLLLLLIQPWEQPRHPIVNDITKLNPIALGGIAVPKTVEQIKELVKEHAGPISIGGGRFSMGGQTATDGALQIDMRQFDKVLGIDEKNMTVTVQPGITWRKLQGELDPLGLSVKIMQTYSNFTVGGSMSVNAHGRYASQGPLIQSVRSFKIVLADGSLVEATPARNSDIFYGAMGGYGGLGVIVEATLELAKNTRVIRRAHRMPVADYADYFKKMLLDSKTAIFHNADLYPPNYDTVNAVTWEETQEPVTEQAHFVPVRRSYFLENLCYFLISELPWNWGKNWRMNYLDPSLYDEKKVEWRNYEASYDVRELEPPSRFFSTYVLNEYFVPAAKLNDFVPKMAAVFQKHNVNIINVSIRHASADPGSLLAWADGETFAFVVYYKQGTGAEDKAEVDAWSKEMVDAVISSGGRYYLPYQPHATLAQFLKAYPRAPEYFALKSKLDPDYKFRSKLWDRYYYRSESEKQARLDAEKFDGYRRGQEQTFLTLPEWYIVFSPDEYAQSLKKAPPSDFPYFSSVAQFWQVYHHVIRESWDAYPVNWGYHAMICVIGTSYTIELVGKGLYENTIGGIAEWIANRKALTKDTVLENYQQQVAQDYVDFIRVKPWYEYPFYGKFKEYWELNESPKASTTRAIERRFFFSTELLFKAAYGWAIGLGTQAAYDPEAEKIGAIIIEDGKHKFVTLPRYQGFTDTAPAMIAKGVQFVEIAGNKRIMATFVAPRKWANPDRLDVMYEWPVLTQPKQKRVAIVLPVEQMHEIIPALEGQDVLVDHIFEY